MERRTFLALASSLLAARALRAQPATRRIGYLSAGTASATRLSQTHRAFLSALAEKGFVVGKNLSIEYRFAEGRIERLPALAEALVADKVEVLFAWSAAAVAAARATRSIPIVFVAISDPVANGLVKSLAHPGGNATGIANEGLNLTVKRLELLKAAVPAARQVAYLAYLEHARYPEERRELLAAAPALGVRVRFAEIEDPDGLAAALARLRDGSSDALLVQEHGVFTIARKTIARFALQQRLPAMAEHALFVQEGLLMSYGQDFADAWRRGGGYVAKILRGAKPAELPVEQPTKFELVINARTAKALALAIPQSVMLRADRLVE